MMRNAEIFKKLEDLVSNNTRHWILLAKYPQTVHLRSQLYKKFNDKYFKKHVHEYTQFINLESPKYYGNYIKTFSRYINYIENLSRWK